MLRSILYSIPILLPVLILGTTGLLARHSLRGLWYASKRGSFLIHDILVGQTILILLVYIHSFLNYIFGIILPINLIEFLLVPALFLAYFWRKDRLKSIIHELCALKYNYAVLLLIIFILLATISNREIPRLIMLSSDPDIHAFGARQIQRFHTIPFTQLYWGPENLNYPAGFAVLNFIWSSLSGLDVRNVVTVQNLVQTLLGILLIYECTCQNENKNIKESGYQLCALLLIFLIYYSLLPYGYQNLRYHLEGTSRLSCLFIMSGSLSLLYFQWINWQKADFGNWFNLPLNAFFIGATVAIAFLMNPANLFIISFMFLVSLVLYLTRFKKWRKVYLTFFSVPGLLIFLMDPYYIDRFIKGKEYSMHSVNAFDLSPLILLEKFYSSLFAKFQTWVPLSNLLELDLLSRDASIVLVLVTLAIGALLSGTKVIKGYQKSIIFVTPFLLLAIFIPISSLMEVVSPYSDFYLLPIYTRSNAQQFIFLWLFSAYGIFISSFINQVSLRYLLVSSILLILSLTLISKTSGNVNRAPRKNHWGSMGFVHVDDLALIGRIEDMFKKYKKSKKHLSYEDIPKILIPNSMLVFGREKWLFPHGASRILPFYNVFPVAFFYFQGDRDYTNESYKRRVCQDFDESWLRKRNIKYLFLPSDRGSVCIHNLEQIIATKTILFKQGNAIFISLSNGLNILNP